MDSRAPSDPVTVLRGHRSDVQSVQFHPSLNILYSGDAEGDINLWNLTTQRIIQTQRLHPASAGIIALALSKQNESTGGFALISQGRDGTIRTWQLDSSGSLSSRHPLSELCSGSYSFCRFSLLEEPAQCPSPCNESSRRTEVPGAVSAPLDVQESSALAQARLQQQQQQQQGSGIGVLKGSLSAALHRDSTQRKELAATVSALPSSLIAFPGEDPSVAQVWDLQACEMLTELRQLGSTPSLGMCMSLQLFSRPEQSGRFLAVGYEAGHVAVWDLGNVSAPVAVTRLHQEPVLGLIIDSSGAGGVTGAAEDKLVCFTIDWAAKKITERQRLSIAKPGIDMIALRPDQRIFATGGWDGRVRVFHFAKCKPLTVLKYHKAAVPALAFRHTDAMLASGSRDGTIALWSVF